MPRTRFIVLVASVPLVVFTLVGGFLGREAAGENPYRHLRILEDVVSLISSNYVEDVDLGAVMDGALRGLTEGLDADSAYLSAVDADRIESGRPLPAGGIGVEVRRRYYLQVVAPLDGAPAARAGVLPGDFIRAIDGEPTRFMSSIEGQRLLRGEPGSAVTISLIRGSTQEPYDIELVREELVDPGVTHRMAAEGVGYVRVAGFGPGTAVAIADAVGRFVFDDEALHIVLDLRNNATGTYEEALAAARLFVADGTLALRQERGDQRAPILAASGPHEDDALPRYDFAFPLTAEEILDSPAGVLGIRPLVLLTNFGTAGPAELFVAALAGQDWAATVGQDWAATVGQRTAGRASEQKLVRLPDGTGLWMSWARYLTPDGEPIDRVGVVPDVAVDVARPELGEPLPQDDPILERALERIAEPIAEPI